MCIRLTIACALVLALAGCRQDRAAAAATAPASATRHEVVAGESNTFFTARSHKAMVVAPGVRSIAITDEAGNQRGVRLVARDNHQATVHCECPGGCTNPDGSGPITVGCLMVSPPGQSPDAPTCVGECSASDQSCMSCGLVYDPTTGNDGWASAEAGPPVAEPGREPPPTGPNDSGR